MTRRSEAIEVVLRELLTACAAPGFRGGDDAVQRAEAALALPVVLAPPVQEALRRAREYLDYTKTRLGQPGAEPINGWVHREHLVTLVKACEAEQAVNDSLESACAFLDASDCGVTIDNGEGVAETGFFGAVVYRGGEDISKPEHVTSQPLAACILATAKALGWTAPKTADPPLSRTQALRVAEAVREQTARDIADALDEGTSCIACEGEGTVLVDVPGNTEDTEPCEECLGDGREHPLDTAARTNLTAIMDRILSEPSEVERAERAVLDACLEEDALIQERWDPATETGANRRNRLNALRSATHTASVALRTARAAEEKR